MSAIDSINNTAGALGSLSQNSQVTSTSLPAWYDTAQQNVVNQAVQGSGAMPALQDTVAGNAINRLSGPNNPFNQAQTSLNHIAMGAANPWMTDASGNVTPDTSTPLGGLFAAQDQQLRGLIPDMTSGAGAGATASGQFGSLRGQTAQDSVVAKALADMRTAQNQAALTSQQTGVNAGTALGNVGAQGTATETTLGQAQQNAPLTATAALANILSTIQAPTTVSNRTNLSPLSVMGQANSLLGSLGAAGGMGGALSGFGSSLKNAIFGNGSGSLNGLFGTGGGLQNGNDGVDTPVQLGDEGGYDWTSPEDPDGEPELLNWD